MSEVIGKAFKAGIVDFNPARMNDAEASDIPPELRQSIADKRQYPFNIARHFPNNVSWLNLDQPWFFRFVMTDEQQVAKLRQSDTLVLTGSGMSAFYFQEGNQQKFPSPEDADLLKRAEEVIRDELSEGKWVLGICFGGQLGVHAVGGIVGRLPTKNGYTVTEAGWLDQELTEAGHRDEVFGFLPRNFSAPHLHNDYVESLPSVGTVVETSAGRMKVVRADVLAVRRGYLDSDGLKNVDHEYIQASLIEFDNGARLYQIQPHPEMATPDKVNFLVRQNPWIEREMGEEHYRNALIVPLGVDLSVSKVITKFIEQARSHYERQQNITFTRAAIAQNLDRLTQYLIE